MTEQATPDDPRQATQGRTEAREDDDTVTAPDPSRVPDPEDGPPPEGYGGTYGKDDKTR